MNSTPGRHGHTVSPQRPKDSPRSRIEWRVVDIPRDVTKAEARAMLTEQAEYGHWELARTQLFIGGARRVWLKRRTLRVERFDAA